MKYIKWIFVVLIVLFIIKKLFLHDSFYKLIMIFGKKGSGKSTLIAKLALKYSRLGYDCYTNFPVAGCYLFNPAHIGDYTFKPNSVVFVDEVGLIWLNRDYKNFRREVVNWFKYQRHYKIRCYLFSQAFDCDKVLRNLTDQLYILKRFGHISIARPVYKSVAISSDQDGNGNIVESYTYGSLFAIRWTYLPRYYGLFDSFAAPPLPLMPAEQVPIKGLSLYSTSLPKFLYLKIKIALYKLRFPGKIFGKRIKRKKSRSH